MKQRKQFGVYENQLTLLLDTNDKNEAFECMYVAHSKATDNFHELYERTESGLVGIRQYAPDDCWNCGRDISRCQCRSLGYTTKS